MRLLAYFTRYAIACLMLAYGIQNEAQAKENAGFCWVPIMNGVPTEADVGSAFRMLGATRFRIPGLPGPVFTPYNRKGVWTVTPDGRFEEFISEFPSFLYDKNNWVFEPENSRVIAASSLGAEYLLQLRIGDKAFHPIPTAQLYRYEPDLPNGFGQTELFRLENPPQTLIETCNRSGNCKLQQVLGETLSPWLDDADIATFDGKSVVHIEQTRDNRVTFVLLSTDNATNSLIYASVDGQPYKFLAELGDGNVFHRDKLGEKDFTFGTSSRVIYIHRNGGELDHEVFDVGRTHRISGPTASGIYNRWIPENFLSRPHFEYVEPGSAKWQPIAGLERHLTKRPYPSRATTLGTDYFSNADGSYLFDGKVARHVTLNGQLWTGAQLRFRDATTLGRLLAFTETEIFEVTKDAVLRRLDSGSMSNIDPSSTKDDPYLGAVTFRSNGKLHAIWPDLSISELIEIVQDEVDPDAPQAPLDIAPWPGVSIETKDNRLWLRINLERKFAPSCGVMR